MTAEGKRTYAIYIQKASKAKELLDYFAMKKSSSRVIMGCDCQKQRLFSIFYFFFKESLINIYYEYEGWARVVSDRICKY